MNPPTRRVVRTARARLRAGCLLLLCSAALGAPHGARAQEHGVRAAPSSLFDYDRAGPLAYAESPIPAPVPGLEMCEIEFASPSGGRVTGLLAVPEPTGGLRGFLAGLLGRSRRRPGVVVMHGMPGSARATMGAWGVGFAQRGAVVVAIDAPWARRGGTLTYTPRDSTEQVQLVRDLRRAVDLLVERDDVDPDRIGFYGGSYGAAIGALLVGVEPRLNTAILRVGGAGLVSRMTDADGEPIEELADLTRPQQERWLEAMDPLEPWRFVAGAAGTPVLYLAGRHDPFVPPEDMETLLAVAPEPRTVRWYDAGHDLGAEADREMLDWMHRHLGLDLEVAETTVPALAPPPDIVRDSARVYARWFVAGRADSLWGATHPQLRERYPEMDGEIRDAMERFRSDTGQGLQAVSERFVWRHDHLQYWQTLSDPGSDLEVVLRLSLLSSGTGGVRGWGWNRPDRVPPVDSAGPVVWLGGPGG